MSTYRLTLYSSTHPHYLTVETITMAGSELWRAIATAKRRLMARRLLAPERTLWDRWTLATMADGATLPSVVATGTPTAVLWQQSESKPGA